MDLLITSLRCLSPIIFFILTGIILLFCFITFDELVKCQKRDFYNIWVEDGKPYGFFWIPKESNLFKGSMARNRLSIQWLFNTPDWVRESEYATKLLLRMRISTILWYMALLIIVARSYLA